MENLFDNLRANTNEHSSEIYKQTEEADEVNKNLPSSSSLTDTLSYTTHPRAIYTSRLLDFKNLPEPKNNDNDEFVETGYSGI